MINKNTLQAIAKHYEFYNQREQFAEECAEAIVAVQKCKRYPLSDGKYFDSFCEEVADVLIMAEQMRLFIGESKVDEIVEKKLSRQLRRIKNEGN